jgi:hypothetical protein
MVSIAFGCSMASPFKKFNRYAVQMVQSPSAVQMVQSPTAVQEFNCFAVQEIQSLCCSKKSNALLFIWFNRFALHLFPLSFP